MAGERSYFPAINDILTPIDMARNYYAQQINNEVKRMMAMNEPLSSNPVSVNTPTPAPTATPVPKSYFPAANLSISGGNPNLFSYNAIGQKNIYNPNGTVSSERTTTIGPERGGSYFNIPTIQQNLGIPLSNQQAITAFGIGQNPAIGRYQSLPEAIAAENQRHAELFGPNVTSTPKPKVNFAF